jgi:predicted O-methyltransferase YrrM
MLPQITWTNLIPPDLQVACRESDTGVDGNLTALELEILCKLVRHTNPKILFEIGTFDGRTTLNLAAHSRPDAQVYTLDLPRQGCADAQLPLDRSDYRYINKDKSGLRFRGSDVEHNIHQLYGDSARFDFRPYRDGVDFLFIDGSHSYRYVLHDSRQAMRMIRSRGLILWHDYVSNGPCCWPGLVQALDELYETDSFFRGLKHIAGTALVVLPVALPWYGKWTRPLSRAWNQARVRWFHRLDSRERDGLRGELTVQVHERRVARGEPFRVQVTATNTGKAVWLPCSYAHGGVKLGCHLFDHAGKGLDYDHCHSPLILDAPVEPGQTVHRETSVPVPPPGRYILDFDLLAEGVCWFSEIGCPTIRTPLEVL